MNAPAKQPVLKLYDTTLRDGSQASDVNFTLDEKLALIEVFDRAPDLVQPMLERGALTGGDVQGAAAQPCGTVVPPGGLSLQPIPPADGVHLERVIVRYAPCHRGKVARPAPFIQ